MERIKHNKISKRKQFSFLRKLHSSSGKKILKRQRMHGRCINKKYGLIKKKILQNLGLFYRKKSHQKNHTPRSQ